MDRTIADINDLPKRYQCLKDIEQTMGSTTDCSDFDIVLSSFFV